MRRTVRAGILLGLLAAGLQLGSTARADAPPGATARCNDGTYSFSQTHSGTCSHHGGVAAWLTPTGTEAPTTVGATVPLLARVRTAGCRLAVLPDRRCSPGAYYDGLTEAVLCSAGFHTSEIRDVPESEKHAVEVAYGLPPKPYGSTLEIDHIVSLELGGSNDIANLYPERAPGFHAKDRLENRLHELVCSGQIALAAAQEQIAADWETLYQRVFGAAPRTR
jgi:hypothetical protein